MFNFNRPVKTDPLDEAIACALSELVGHEAHDDDYAKIVKQISKLNAIKEKDKTDRLSKDTIALVLGNIVGILLITNHEQLHVVTSKALPFVGKFK